MNHTQNMETVHKYIDRIGVQMDLIELCMHNIRGLSGRHIVWNDDRGIPELEIKDKDGEIPKIWNTVRLASAEIKIIARKIRHILGDRYEPRVVIPGGYDFIGEFAYAERGYDGTMTLPDNLAIVRDYYGRPTTIDIRKIERYRIQNDQMKSRPSGV